ncbi:MAG: hypothetical protein KBB75_01820 [Candidatus Pacebacteria bacterium]|jgi:hypothetical protein|nr:hypothetical protein [Candidatus Paceibacterota bacterium]
MNKKLYKEITTLFQKEMIKQLSDNKRKGDRAGWLSCEPMQLVLEIYYHTGKLQEAVKNNKKELIREYTADVANIAMMVLDKSGGLLPLAEKNSLEKPNTTWTKNIIQK